MILNQVFTSRDQSKNKTNREIGVFHMNFYLYDEYNDCFRKNTRKYFYVFYKLCRRKNPSFSPLAPKSCEYYHIYRIALLVIE